MKAAPDPTSAIADEVPGLGIAMLEGYDADR